MHFPLKNLYLKDDYVVSKANEEIYDIICNSNQYWGIIPYKTILFIIGSEASGKTHLAHIWSELYGSVFIQSFNEIYQYDASGYIVDDISRIEEEELLHIINYLNEEKKLLLITSRKMPTIILPDLASRIKAISTKYIGHIDDYMMKILLTKYFVQYSLDVSVDVIDFLNMRLERNFAEIKNFIFKLDNLALKTRRNITIPLIKSLLEKEM